ncbi:UNVERIFIED_CONTAM: RGG repeats nuclear RNA binding protein A [Sesamum latifolium]|uniref:RGG repeats nuclear RNA binding protein A n=1 Tax=Sesamum latifolium TaxID=2727402 RepID=A0AAW2SST4_9LAMI
MATLNPFGLLGDDDAEDPTLLLAAQQKAAGSALAAAQPKKAPSQAQPAAKASAKLPSKPLPPAQAVRESRNDGQRGGRGGVVDAVGGDLAEIWLTMKIHLETVMDSLVATRLQKMEMVEGLLLKDVHMVDLEEVGVSVVLVVAASIMVKLPRVTVLEGRSIAAVELGVDHQFLNFRETEEPTNEGVKNVDSEKQSGEDDVFDANKDSSANEQEEKEPEEKEMTLEEYEKVLEEKRKALLALKSEERKVGLDKELQSMQLLSNKKNDDEVFIKLGSDKDKRKEAAEKAKKSVSINEFLKPAEGDKYYRAGGRGRGRGRGRGGFGGNNYNVEAPAIEDVGQFPSLVAK